MSSNDHKKIIKKYDDPEFEAEILYAKENGLKMPTMLPSKEKAAKDTVNKDDSAIAGFVTKLKNQKSEKKIRSRGVSGCSIKKDGNRFKYGLDCVDLAYENNRLGADSSSEEEYTEYADYVCHYNNSKIKSVILEFFVNGNFEDAMSGIEAFTITKDLSERTISDLIILSLEGDASWYELAAALLEKMIENQWVTGQNVVNVLEDIFDCMDDLLLDNPNAIETIAVIVAKLVDDNIIDGHSIQIIKQKLTHNANAKKCIETSETMFGNRYLLKGKWIPSGGHQSLSLLSKEFKSILVEYLQSNDVDSASNRVKELKVSHFNHELVYQASIMALEKMHDVVILQLIKLMKHMLDVGQLLHSCVEKGFERLFEGIDDLYVDLPAAYSLARRWVNKCHEEKLISEHIADKCPVCGRSRTLSRGPDGKLSVDNEDLSSISEGDQLNKGAIPFMDSVVNVTML